MSDITGLQEIERLTAEVIQLKTESEFYKSSYMQTLENNLRLRNTINQQTAEIQSACQALLDRQNENERLERELAQAKHAFNMLQHEATETNRIHNQEVNRQSAELHKVAEDRNDHWRLCNLYEEQLKIAEVALRTVIDGNHAADAAEHLFVAITTAKSALDEIVKRSRE